MENKNTRDRERNDKLYSILVSIEINNKFHIL
jgi:hypothetical protein